MKIPVDTEKNSDGDWKVFLELPDGFTITVLIPSDIPRFFNGNMSEWGEVGLNLVTDGHYY